MTNIDFVSKIALLLKHMIKEAPYPYRLCPVSSCLADFNRYRNPEANDVVVVEEFREYYSLKSVFDLMGPVNNMLNRIERVLEEEPVRMYFSKLESLMKSKEPVSPVSILPSLERHPLVCSAFPIPKTMFSLHLQRAKGQADGMISSYEISLLGIKEENKNLVGTHKFMTVRAFNLSGKEINHL